MQVILGSGGGVQENSIQGARTIERESITGTRKTFSLVYIVKPSNGESACNMDEEDAMAANGVPSLRSIINNAYCISKSAVEVDSLNGIWEVTCNFDSKIADATTLDASDNPVKWSWSVEEIEKVITRDAVDGEAIANSVGEPLILTRPVSIPVLTITKLKTSFDPDEIMDYCNHVNSTAFWGAPVDCARLASISDEESDYNGGGYRKVTYTIKFDLEIDYDGLQLGWSAQLLNHGTFYWQEDGANPGNPIVPRVPIPFKARGDQVTGNLTLTGLALSSALPAVYRVFKRYPRAELNDLDLGPF